MPSLPERHTIEVTFTDVNYELFRLLTGYSVLDTLPTPQNRDTWRRETLQKAQP
jgi:hypothetical protein